MTKRYFVGVLARSAGSFYQILSLQECVTSMEMMVDLNVTLRSDLLASFRLYLKLLAQWLNPFDKEGLI